MLHAVILQGSCGYGLLDQSQWPYWSVGALAGGSSFSSGVGKGCGICLEVTCVDGGAVRSAYEMLCSNGFGTVFSLKFRGSFMISIGDGTSNHHA